MNKRDLNNIQIFLSSIFIITILISTLINYNENTNNKILNADEVRKLSIITRIASIILLIGFLYVSYKEKELNNKKETIYLNDLSILVSYINLLAGILAFYITFKRRNTFDNPTI